MAFIQCYAHAHKTRHTIHIRRFFNRGEVPGHWGQTEATAFGFGFLDRPQLSKDEQYKPRRRRRIYLDRVVASP